MVSQGPRTYANVSCWVQESPDVSLSFSESTGMKAHLLSMHRYFLEQHLKRDEAILPDSKQLGHFRGTEVVYSASSIVNVKSVENYYRVGYVVREDEVPMKWVKKRSVTINKKREEAAALYDGQQEAMEGLYAESQTEIYVPPPIVDVSGPGFAVYFPLGVYSSRRLVGNREKSQEMISEISTCLYHRCCQLVLFISHVCSDAFRRTMAD